MGIILQYSTPGEHAWMLSLGGTNILEGSTVVLCVDGVVLECEYQCSADVEKRMTFPIYGWDLNFLNESEDGYFHSMLTAVPLGLSDGNVSHHPPQSVVKMHHPLLGSTADAPVTVSYAVAYD
jgi:hypothetical protein